MKSCQNCGFSNEDNAKFCKIYGQKIIDISSNQNCKQCGKPITSGTRFCKHCGSPVEIKIEPVQEVRKVERVESKKEEPKKTRSKSISTIITITTIVIMIVVVVFASQRLKEDYYSDNQNYIDNDSYNDENNFEQEEYKNQNVVIDEDEYEETTDEQETAQSDDYILASSDSKYLNKADLYGLSAEECRLARNEIYARHGRMFKDAALQEYFESFDWYYPTIQPDDFEESMLNEYEIANRDLIVEYELEQGYR